MLHAIHPIGTIAFRPITWPHGFNPVFWGGGFFGILLAVLLFLLPFMLLAGLIDLIFSPSSSNFENTNTYDHSFELLKERFVKGEISRAEFEDKKKALKRG